MMNIKGRKKKKEKKETAVDENEAFSTYAFNSQDEFYVHTNTCIFYGFSQKGRN